MSCLEKKATMKEIGDYKMTGNNYVELAMRTNDGNAKKRLQRQLDSDTSMNIKKLKARYPEGFSIYAANHRKEGDI